MRIECLLFTLFVAVAFPFLSSAQEGQWIEAKGTGAFIASDGTIRGFHYGHRDAVFGVQGMTEVEGCHVVSTDRVASTVGAQFRRELDCQEGRHLTIEESFRGTDTSIRWLVRIVGSGDPWSAPIYTKIHYPQSPDLRFFTAWSNPDQKGGWGWHDPLQPAPLRNQTWFYGSPPFRHRNPNVSFIPFDGNLFSLPIATILDPARGRGFSVALSPEDRILGLTMLTTSDGTVSFERVHHRFGGSSVVSFAVDLIGHEAGWRGGLRWLVSRYEDYFNPVNPVSGEIGGLGGYSTVEKEFDSERFHQMAFSVNWKASFDFPYMGMFLPPVGTAERWNRFSFKSPRRYKAGAEAPNGTTSIDQMANYCQHMNRLGFHVLNYFNVTEFGAFIKYPQPPIVTSGAKDRWKDANDFLYSELSEAILFVPDSVPAETLSAAQGSVPGGPYVSWGDSVVMDCAIPQYQEFLIEQAKRHIEELPYSSGICIDRLDWLRMYNDRRDDGVSWVEGKPAWSLYISWERLMERLGPLMHDAGKVIFCNNHDKRLDTLKHIDGLYDEFGYAGAPLNLTALQGIRKPVIAWTASKKDLGDDHDAFFQRYLYLGVYPTAPLPGNDHAIVPDPEVDRSYLAYGPLFAALKGRTWDLTADAISAQGAAKVNLFQIPCGYAAPVTFAGSEDRTQITLRLDPGSYTVEVVHPGGSKASLGEVVSRGESTSLVVPLVKGCALIRLVGTCKE